MQYETYASKTISPKHQERNTVFILYLHASSLQGKRALHTIINIKIRKFLSIFRRLVHKKVQTVKITGEIY